MLVHREVMAAHIGRALTDAEVVHHKDHDPTNNRIDNLELTTPSGHSLIHAGDRPAEILTLTCIHCGLTFSREARRERANRAQGKTGPYCGASCRGKALASANTSSIAAMNAARRVPRVHGTRSMYRDGCRCGECRAGNAARHLAWKRASAR